MSFIKIFPRTMTPDECRALLAFVEQEGSNFTRSLTYDVGKTDVSKSRTSTSLRITGERRFLAVDHMLMGIFGRAREEYFLSLPEVYRRLSVAGRDEGYDASRYLPGEFFTEHIDDGLVRPRRLTAILYPNDDYKGGELRFPVQDLTVKPKAGDAILFPASFEYIHESTPIESGTKYIFSTWFR